MNLCNQHVCNPTYHKTNVDTLKNLSRYNSLQFLINETHFDNETKLLHIKRIDKWLNNVNAWIISAFTCNHDMKFIKTSTKHSKSLIYYIID